MQEIAEVAARVDGIEPAALVSHPGMHGSERLWCRTCRWNSYECFSYRDRDIEKRKKKAGLDISRVSDWLQQPHCGNLSPTTFFLWAGRVWLRLCRAYLSPKAPTPFPMHACSHLCIYSCSERLCLRAYNITEMPGLGRLDSYLFWSDVLFIVTSLLMS